MAICSLDGVSKASHSISWLSKSVPQPVMLKKMKLNYSIKTYKTLELEPKKDVLFIIGDWNAKVGSRNTWSNRQIWPWRTEWSRAKASRVLPKEHTGHSKHPFPTTQEKTLHMDIIRWSVPISDDYILCSQIWRSSIWADCGSDYELLIAKMWSCSVVSKSLQPHEV